MSWHTIPTAIPLMAVRVPIISKMTGYYLLVSLPLVVLSIIYAKDITMLANAKFQEAYVLIPYLSVACFFLALAEYTTMQYLLCKKTYINTIIKVISGIIGIGLNYLFIVKMGVIGAGIATMLTNLLYFLLSVIVVMPGLNWQIPYTRILQIIISLIPMGAFCYFFKYSTSIHPWGQMALLLIIYCTTFLFVKSLIDESHGMDRRH